jgi:predicted nucleic acid-binding protein
VIVADATLFADRVPDPAWNAAVLSDPTLRILVTDASAREVLKDDPFATRAARLGMPNVQVVQDPVLSDAMRATLTRNFTYADATTYELASEISATLYTQDARAFRYIQQPGSPQYSYWGHVAVAMPPSLS